MQVSDWINVVLCILSFGLAAISVVTVIITIKQNHKMIQNSTRPYIVATSEITNYQNPQMYLVLKNYGNSGATIESFNSSIDLTKYSMVPEHVPFNSIDNTFFAPGQKMICPINSKLLKEDGHTSFEIKISYKDNIHTYTEKCPINFIALTKNVQLRASTKDKELKIISYILQDIAEKQL